MGEPVSQAPIWVEGIPGKQCRSVKASGGDAQRKYEGQLGHRCESWRQLGREAWEDITAFG